MDILGSRERRFAIINEELTAISDAYATPRRTVIEEAEADYDIEELIPREDMVVTVSHGGYVKRVPLDTYRAQRRGGKGRSGMSTRDDDFVTEVMVCAHTPCCSYQRWHGLQNEGVITAGTPQSAARPWWCYRLPWRNIDAFLPLPGDNEHEDKFIILATASEMFAATA